MRKIRGTLNLCVSYVLEFLLAPYETREFVSVCRDQLEHAATQLCFGFDSEWVLRQRQTGATIFPFFPLLPRGTSIIRAPEVRAWLHEHQCTERDTEERILRRY